MTSRRYGFPLMFLILAAVFWITIVGGEHSLGISLLHPHRPDASGSQGDGPEPRRLPWWLSGILFDGMYLATAWVVSVMLPPMAIFFPLFTLLEDFGYLPRVAFNLDSLFAARELTESRL